MERNSYIGLIRGDAAAESKVLKYNKHGHVVFTITGLDLTGYEEIERLQASGYYVSEYAKQMLIISTKTGGYDSKHRLIVGQEYRIVLLPSKNVISDLSHTMKSICSEAEKFRYNKPLAGIMPRIRELISDEQMKEIGFTYISAFHSPVVDAFGATRVFNSNCFAGGRRFCSYWVSPHDQWDDAGAFAFFSPD